MPTLVLADIHGNLPALEAVLAHPAAQRCSDIISLGDHVNFSPQSRAVHERLTELGAVMLLDRFRTKPKLKDSNIVDAE